MSFNFSLFRLLILAILVAAFLMIGGFNPPDLNRFGTVQLLGTWLFSVGTFLAGAVLVSVVDCSSGPLKSVNLRPLYIFVGILLMVFGVIWHYLLGDMLLSDRGLEIWLR